MGLPPDVSVEQSLSMTDDNGFYMHPPPLAEPTSQAEAAELRERYSSPVARQRLVKDADVARDAKTLSKQTPFARMMAEMSVIANRKRAVRRHDLRYRDALDIVAGVDVFNSPVQYLRLSEPQHRTHFLQCLVPAMLWKHTLLFLGVPRPHGSMRTRQRYVWRLAVDEAYAIAQTKVLSKRMLDFVADVGVQGGGVGYVPVQRKTLAVVGAKVFDIPAWYRGGMRPVPPDAFQKHRMAMVADAAMAQREMERRMRRPEPTEAQRITQGRKMGAARRPADATMRAVHAVPRSVADITRLPAGSYAGAHPLYSDSDAVPTFLSGGETADVDGVVPSMTASATSTASIRSSGHGDHNGVNSPAQSRLEGSSFGTLNSFGASLMSTAPAGAANQASRSRTLLPTDTSPARHKQRGASGVLLTTLDSPMNVSFAGSVDSGSTDRRGGAGTSVTAWQSPTREGGSGMGGGGHVASPLRSHPRVEGQLFVDTKRGVSTLRSPASLVSSLHNESSMEQQLTPTITSLPHADVAPASGTPTSITFFRHMKDQYYSVPGAMTEHLQAGRRFNKHGTPVGRARLKELTMPSGSPLAAAKSLRRSASAATLTGNGAGGRGGDIGTGSPQRASTAQGFSSAAPLPEVLPHPLQALDGTDLLKTLTPTPTRNRGAARTCREAVPGQSKRDYRDIMLDLTKRVAGWATSKPHVLRELFIAVSAATRYCRSLQSAGLQTCTVGADADDGGLSASLGRDIPRLLRRGHV
jgi:hypothetical protein